MIEWMVSSSVLILVLIMVRGSFKGKINLRLQYSLWILVLVRLLVPVSFGNSEFSIINLLPETILQEDFSDKAESVQGKLPAVIPVVDASVEETGEKQKTITGMPYGISIGSDAEHPIETKPEHIQTLKAGISFLELWKIIWLLGVVLVGSVFLTANVMFACRIRKTRKKVENSNGHLRIYWTEALDTPCLFGLFSPAIYLTPESMEKETTQRHIIEHETTHYRHGDHIWAMLRGICLMLHWYNPLVWWAAALSGADAELACDEGTILRLGEQERADYGHTLLDMTCRKRSNRLVAATMMTGGKRRMKERITLLVKNPKMATITLIAVSALALVAVGCTFTGSKEEVPVNGEVTPTPTLTLTLTPPAVPTEAAKVTPTIVAESSPEPTVAPMSAMQEQKETEKAVLDIQSKLEDVELTYQELQKKLHTDLNLSQGEMNDLAAECVILWEDTLDTFWYALEPLLTAEEVETLHKEQQEWLTARDAEVQVLIEKYDGGSITGLVVGMRKAELARKRTYALAEQLIQVMNRITGASWKDYSGHYVNTQETDIIYDELKLELLEDGTYRTEIGIYRLTTLEGTAVAYGDMLWFEDTAVGVKGNIRFFDNEVVFTVTESDFSYLTPGEGFEFIKSE